MHILFMWPYREEHRSGGPCTCYKSVTLLWDCNLEDIALGHNLLIISFSSGGFAQTDAGGRHSMAIMPLFH